MSYFSCVTVAADALEKIFFTAEEIAYSSYYIKNFATKLENRLIFFHAQGSLQAEECGF